MARSYGTPIATLKLRSEGGSEAPAIAYQTASGGITIREQDGTILSIHSGKAVRAWGDPISFIRGHYEGIPLEVQ